MDNEYLSHHGIKGQKWGVRRFQNADGSLTSAGRKRYGSGESSGTTDRKGLTDSQKQTLKNVGKAALIAGGVAAAGYLYSRNSEAVNSAISAMAKTTMSELNGTKQVTKALGKSYIKKTAEETYSEIIKPAASKVLKASAQGVAIMATKKMLETVAGKENVADTIQAYNAYNKKNKVGKVPDIGNRNRTSGDDEDDDD